MRFPHAEGEYLDVERFTIFGTLSRWGHRRRPDDGDLRRALCLRGFLN